MAGQPVRRQREAEARARAGGRAKRSTPALRAKVVARANLVGPAAAAAEFQLEPALVRKWCSRSKPSLVLTSSPATEGEPAQTPSQDRLESMRRARDSHRAVEEEALARISTLIAVGDGTEARNVATAAGIASDKALALDKAIVAAEVEHEAEATRLRSETLELQRDVLRATFTAIDIPIPLSSMRELATRAAAGEPLDVPEEVAAGDREHVRAAIRDEYRAELIAEGWVLPDGDDGEEEGHNNDCEENGDAIAREDKEAELHGRHEHANVIAREAARRGNPVRRRQSRWAATTMNHPGLS